MYIAGKFPGHILGSLESTASHHRFPLFSNHVAIELVPFIIALGVQSTVAAIACRANWKLFL